MTLTFGSVCSGIEAASAAWAPLGWRCAFVSEIEAFPRAVLKHHYPEVPLHGDFTTIQAGEYEPIDLLVGGTPCQSFSVAGLRGGLDDERGNLALEYLRLADRLRPRWLVWENVPGVLSSNGGRDFGSILGGLVELGYGFAYRVLDAQFFGVAQRRRRVFVVGHLGDWRRAAAVLFERHSLQGHPAPRRKAGKGAAPTVTGGARRGGGYSEDDIPHVAHALNAHGGPCGRIDAESETFVASFAPALSRSNPYGDHESREGLLVAHSLRAEGFDASEDGTGRGTPIVPITFMSNASGANLSFGHDMSPCLRVGGDGGNAMAVAFDLAQITGATNRTRVSPELPASTLNAKGQLHVAGVTIHGTDKTATAASMSDLAGSLRTKPPGSVENSSTTAALHGSAVRRLTPRECERLQGFPDDFTLIPWRKGMAPDGPRYKALGNSMAVPVMRWIGERIEAVEAMQAERSAA